MSNSVSLRTWSDSIDAVAMNDYSLKYFVLSGSVGAWFLNKSAASVIGKAGW